MGYTFDRIVFKESTSPGRIITNLPPPPPPRIKMLKKGGNIKPSENIIPNGVLHEEFNKLGDKGMPVVKCNLKDNSCNKEYEIEKDEMILTLKTTKAIEKLAKKEMHKELGIFVKNQILNNTHSYTEKFQDLNKYITKDETIFA